MLVLTGAAFALATRVIPESDLAKRVPMTKLAYQPPGFDTPVHTSDFVVTQDTGYQDIVRGRDKSGKPWDMVLPAATHGIWETELNGLRTYYFAGYTGGAGMAPGAWILILSFDEKGRPAPFYVRGYAVYDSKGIMDVLNLDGTGPELLQQNWVETNSIPDTRSGYYVTTLYQQRGIYWYRADGRHGAKNFPLFERWVMLPNRQPEEVAAPRESKEWLSDFGNDPKSGIRSRILSANESGIDTGPELGCRLESVDVVVRDSPKGREIQMDPFFAGRSGTVLEEIAKARVSAIFTGLNGKGRCRASVVWAESNSK